MSESIKKYTFKEGLKLEFEILDLLSAFEVNKEMMSIPHRAQFYHILWIEEAEGTHFIDFNPIKLENNSLIFVPQNAVNMFDIKGQYKGKSIIFTDTFFSKNNDDLKFLTSSILYSDLYPTTILKLSERNDELKSLMNALQIEFIRDKDRQQSSILHNLLHAFLLQSERELQNQGFKELKQGSNLDYLILFKDLLEKNFRVEKAVNKYASDLSISEKQLYKATTSLIDKTPKQIIDERIMLEAKRLLVHSNQSIKEIAYDLGYDEPTNFIKYFKKHADMTPSEFREKY